MTDSKERAGHGDNRSSGESGYQLDCRLAKNKDVHSDIVDEIMQTEIDLRKQNEGQKREDPQLSGV